LFGRGFRATRTEAGLTNKEAAQLAGFELSEWAAVEVGRVPLEVNRLRSMAEAREITFEELNRSTTTNIEARMAWQEPAPMCIVTRSMSEWAKRSDR
jgi:hypothetical protein